MNEMIERVARALATEHFNKNKHKGYCTQKERVQYLVNEYWKNHINDAKAAIQAMREPTDNMLSAADYSGSLEEGSSALGCWQAMINEALK